ncbi:HipA domain-containing protein [Arcicella aquatica]|uniref:HipA domain-containing protein n=1 Tax=Arcicella aquatica TaxID=217141 RepID=A0ABU5QT33_9BACT|nr:HipA domain-containing protein [Arcicella aquatica]MEA5259551.1 HipA domain-containing protein [Arcicella aquatica]
MAEKKRHITVFTDWESSEIPQLMGELSATQIRGKEIFAFEYDKQWLKVNEYLFSLDPDLALYSGKQYLNDTKSNFGIFMDSSPDRWGRLLMRRREAAMARLEGRKEQLLFETDYLLGVYDQHRMGAIRFKESIEGPFLNDNRAMAAPPFTSLRELEQASLQLEKDDSVDNPDYLKWLNMLIAPGSSLGGARPKASIVDTNKHLWIAKFPSNFDNRDTAAWEMVIYELAQKSGIQMSEAMIQKFSGHHHTFLTKRFDRVNSKRIHFASAMTLLGYTDGTDFQDGVSYLHLAEFIMRNGSNVEGDLEQLWRRIVFNICVSNTDDHLRNHGFLLTKKGWELSPAFDINPIETGTGLKLNISENDNALDTNLALEVAIFFRLKQERAKQIIEEIKRAVAEWKTIATKYKISRNEQEMISRAFMTV